jgi:hypothetical protein
VRQVSDTVAEDRWDPDPALDVWDPEWDSDWEPPQDWAAGQAGPAGEPAGPEDEVHGWTGEGEAFAAGFLHRYRYDDMPRGTGFASGGLLDELEAGPPLAAQASKATSEAAGGHAALGESELIGVLCAWRRLASWAAAGQAAAIEALSRRRHTQALERENPHLAEHVGDEIAAALTLTGRAAGGLYDDVLALSRLPQVHQRLAAGGIDWAKALVFARDLCQVPRDAAVSIAANVLPEAPSLTTAQIRNRLHRLVLEFDPDAERKRKAEAARDTDVVMWTETSGNAALAGRELPESAALAADRRLTALARWLAGHGVEGSLGQLRAAAYMALLQGSPLQSLLPPGSPAAEDPAGPAAGAQPALTGSIHLTMPLSAWAGLSDTAGEVAGYGPADAAACRDLAAMMAAGPGTRWQISLVNAAGRAIATAAAKAGHAPPPGPAALRWARGMAAQLEFLRTRDCDHTRAEDSYEPSRRLRNLIRFRQPECSFPGCRRPAARCDLDHTKPYDQGGLTCECNLHRCAAGTTRPNKPPAGG